MMWKKLMDLNLKYLSKQSAEGDEVTVLVVC